MNTSFESIRNLHLNTDFDLQILETEKSYFFKYSPMSSLSNRSGLIWDDWFPEEVSDDIFFNYHFKIE
jgi:hypothetical protein